MFDDIVGLNRGIASHWPLGRSHSWRLVCGATILLAAVAGCQKKNSAETAKTPPPPEVAVVSPVEREYTQSEEFIGRLEAAEVVEIRARVGGYLDQVLFKDGSEVKQGDLLAVIDPRTYEAEVGRASAGVQQAKARVQRLHRQLERGKQLIGTRVISQDEFDLMKFDHAEADAAQQLAEASERLAQLNLEFTKIRAPVSGKISRRLVDPGNLVKADDTLLAVIGLVDPIRAYFEIDERTVLRLRQMILKGEMPLPTEQKLEVEVSLADDNSYSLRGVIDFTDTALDSRTGTLRARAIIDNRNLLLLPGLIVRCRMPIGSARNGLFVPEEALGSDQGQRFLYALNDKDEVVYRRVSVGMQMSDWRLVEGDLSKGDRVIVSGLQRVRSGQKVAPKASTQYAGDRPKMERPEQRGGAQSSTKPSGRAG